MLTSNKYIGTILNKRRWMRLIRGHKKTCEIKSKLINLPKSCKHLVFHGNRKLRAGGCRYNLMATLLSQTPLGPFKTAKAVTGASKIPGGEFKTGMSEGRLDRFIQASASKEAYVYRFEAAHVSNRVVWNDRKGNNHPGFLPMMNKRKGWMRFCVTEPEHCRVSGPPKIPRTQAKVDIIQRTQAKQDIIPRTQAKQDIIPRTQAKVDRIPRIQAKQDIIPRTQAKQYRIPRIQAKVDARLRLEASRFIGPHPRICDLTLD